LSDQPPRCGEPNRESLHGDCSGRKASSVAAFALRPPRWPAVVAAFGMPAAGCIDAAGLPRSYSAPPTVNVEAIELAGTGGSFGAFRRDPARGRAGGDDGHRLRQARRDHHSRDVAWPTTGDGHPSLDRPGPRGRHDGGGSGAPGGQRNPRPGASIRTPCVTVTNEGAAQAQGAGRRGRQEAGRLRPAAGSSSLLAALVAAEGLTKEAGMDVENPPRHSAQRSRRNAGCRAPARVGPGARRTDGLLPEQTRLAKPSRHADSEPRRGRPEPAGSCSLEDGDVVHVAKRTLKPNLRPRAGAQAGRV